MENANSLIYETNRFMGEYGESMFIRKKKKNINPPYQTLAPQFVSVGLQSLHLDLAAFALGASCR